MFNTDPRCVLYCILCQHNRRRIPDNSVYANSLTRAVLSSIASSDNIKKKSSRQVNHEFESAFYGQKVNVLSRRHMHTIYLYIIFKPNKELFLSVSSRIRISRYSIHMCFLRYISRQIGCEWSTSNYIKMFAINVFFYNLTLFTQKMRISHVRAQLRSHSF